MWTADKNHGAFVLNERTKPRESRRLLSKSCSDIEKPFWHLHNILWRAGSVLIDSIFNIIILHIFFLMTNRKDLFVLSLLRGSKCVSIGI